VKKNVLVRLYVYCAWSSETVENTRARPDTRRRLIVYSKKIYDRRDYAAAADLTRALDIKSQNNDNNVIIYKSNAVRRETGIQWIDIEMTTPRVLSGKTEL